MTDQITDNKILVNPQAAEALGIEVPKPEQVVYNLFKQEPYEFLTFFETPYTKSQKDLKRLDKMDNALTESYHIEDKNGKKITIRVPQRLSHLIKEPE